VFWDITCIAGLSPGRLDPQLDGTVFPNTIGQAASFDVGLVARIGAATALEGRITNQMNYRTSGGTTWQGTLCDGGPLANTAHDPRWGRTSETYGEDVFLTQAMGIAATRALQQRTAPDPATGLAFLKTSQVTRHYMGTHGANDMANDAEEYILPQWREEHQMRIYEAFQRPDLGDAEGIMCAISAFAEAGDVPPPRNNETRKPYVPNCANPDLMTQKLRTEWGSDCFVQSDCCDSIDAVVSHKWVDTLPEAVAAVMNAGLSASYGNFAGITAALKSALASGLITNATFDARIQRTLLTLFRVGMFDSAFVLRPAGAARAPLRSTRHQHPQPPHYPPPPPPQRKTPPTPSGAPTMSRSSTAPRTGCLRARPRQRAPCCWRTGARPPRCRLRRCRPRWPSSAPLRTARTPRATTGATKRSGRICPAPTATRTAGRRAW
jgi:beta-glucosidase-like glycosyl hydrolase